MQDAADDLAGGGSLRLHHSDLPFGLRHLMMVDAVDPLAPGESGQEVPRPGQFAAVHQQHCVEISGADVGRVTEQIETGQVGQVLGRFAGAEQGPLPLPAAGRKVQAQGRAQAVAVRVLVTGDEQAFPPF